ncbi:MAG: hypothetical protein V4772_09600 [Pseudomonadota bacterium]
MYGVFVFARDAEPGDGSRHASKAGVNGQAAEGFQRWPVPLAAPAALS